MKRQKLVTLILAATMALSFTACGGEEEVTLPPHENWTAEELSQVLYINGKNVSFPCSLDDLGEDYTFSEDIEPEYKEEHDETRMAVNYKGEYFGLAYYQGVMPEDVNRGLKVNGLAAAPLKQTKQTFSVNGVRAHVKPEEITELMGTPDDMGGNGSCLYKYDDRENETIIGFLLNDNGVTDGVLVVVQPSEKVEPKDGE